MEYVMLIYSAEERWNALSDEEKGKVIESHQALSAKAQADGTLRGGNRLVDTPSATTVRKNNGKPVVTDGPFAETKEQLGGYYRFECDDLDKMIEYANMLDYADGGSVEIRPVFEM